MTYEQLTRQATKTISLYAALLAEAATRDEKTLLTLYRSQFHMMSEKGFLAEAEEFRAAMRLPPLEREDF
ncbi:hypothetical protein [Franconibacter daqui]|uniref:hypothetical protein n=1 Tax=Franconibacter daqui TaxID=2047724 RepID=UPI002DB8447E|nr:hypothetical protein [Franconibacter daqui]MEB5924757.1 hypothetical protein [Franconibacter daqui]